MEPILSVVFGTLNRKEFLTRALLSIPNACDDLSFEIVVVDGSPDNDTRDLLLAAKFNGYPIRIIAERTRRGAVAAFNRGFREASGEFVASFNDDAEYVGAPLFSAVQSLRADPNIGQIAIPFLTHKVTRASEITTTRPERILPEVANVKLPVLGTVPYANFSVIRRTLGDELGWWGDYYQYAGDTHLSAGVWARGFAVVPLPHTAGYIIHYEAQDDTRVPNVETKHFDAVWRGADSPILKRHASAYKTALQYVPKGLK